MASINKQSVRDEFDKIKTSFNEQVRAGKVSAETALLFNVLIMLLSLVLSIFMEKTTKKTSANSHIPPSQTTEDETTAKKDKKGSDKNKDETVTVVGNFVVTLSSSNKPG